MQNIQGVVILSKRTNNQIKMIYHLVFELNFVKYKVEKNYSSSTLPNTITIEIYTNLKCYDNHYCSTSLEDKLNHILVT